MGEKITSEKSSNTAQATEAPMHCWMLHRTGSAPGIKGKTQKARKTNRKLSTIWDRKVEIKDRAA